MESDITEQVMDTGRIIYGMPPTRAAASIDCICSEVCLLTGQLEKMQPQIEEKDCKFHELYCIIQERHCKVRNMNEKYYIIDKATHKHSHTHARTHAHTCL